MEGLDAAHRFLGKAADSQNDPIVTKQGNNEMAGGSADM